MWRLDVIGQINKNTSKEHRFILVAISYFTKWIEASSYTHVTHTCDTEGGQEAC